MGRLSCAATFSAIHKATDINYMPILFLPSFGNTKE